MNDSKDPISARLQTARETAEALERVSPRNDPTLEDVARFHELHARHERELGHEVNARAAEERARRMRQILAKRC